MVEATNYIYLAFLICLQYLGLQHDSYQVTIDFSKLKEFEQQASISVDFEKKMGNENQWTLISLDKKHEIPFTVVKDSVTDFERGTAGITKFKDIDFDRLSKQTDTIFNKKNKPLMVTLKNENAIVFKVLDSSLYKRITMKIVE